ncbi:hypothetical protein TorRG33x02_357760, partial [Trema orientale]
MGKTAVAAYDFWLWALVLTHKLGRIIYFLGKGVEEEEDFRAALQAQRGSAPAIARVRPLRIGGGHGLGASTAPPPHTLVQSWDHHVGPVIASILSP